jgi:hypothetical protein
MLLKSEEISRTNINPFNKFFRKWTVDPITEDITYENVPSLLEVESILLKNFNFIVLGMPSYTSPCLGGYNWP